MTSQFYSIDDVENSTKLSNPDTNDTESINKSVSKMRSYLKRCEIAINSINLSAKRSLSLSSSSTAATTPNDVGTSKSTASSWYVDEFSSEIVESRCITSKTDTLTQRIEPTNSNADGQTTSVLNESANNCIPKLQQQQVTWSPVRKFIIFVVCFGKIMCNEKVKKISTFFQNSKKVHIDLNELIFIKLSAIPFFMHFKKKKK